MPSVAHPSAVQRLQITGLTYGPHGLARLDGKVVFVRSVVPGETVDVTLREDHRSYAYADLQAVITAAPERRVPPCMYLPRCGGCPWQHLHYSAQLQAKQQNLRDHLVRNAGLSSDVVLPIIGSPQEFAYRNRLTLRVENRHLGFYAGASHDLVAIDQCLLGSEPIAAALASTADLVSRLDTHLRRIEIVERGTQPGVLLRGEAQGPFCERDATAITTLLTNRDVAGVVIHGRHWRRVWGAEHLTLAPEEGLTLTARCGAFTQVNPAANQLLVRTVLTAGGFQPTHRVLDLYSGVGNLTFPIARRAAQVVAVEQDSGAAEDARRNATALGMANCEVITAAARKALRELRNQGRSFDVVVLDPPRSGAAEVVAALLDLRPARLVYVSCNPATLARDLARMTGHYRVESVQPIDLFPQSYHVEAVATAVLTC